MSFRSVALFVLIFAAVPCVRAAEPTPLPTGKFITPLGTQTGVGNFPDNALLTPDGKFLVVTNTGSREFVSVLDARDGRLVSQAKVDGPRKDKPAKKKGLYYGLAFAPGAKDGYTLYASRGEEQAVGVYTIDAQGDISNNALRLIESPNDEPDFPRVIAGLALSGDGRRLYAVDNNATSQSGLKGALLILDTKTDRLVRAVELPGFPFAVAALTKGPQAERKVYVSGERDGIISVVDPEAGNVTGTIATGERPIALLLDAAQRRLFVANAGSDTVSVIDTATDKIIDTILVRPEDARGLPGATPTGLALAPGERRLYATLAGMNAVAVIDLPGKGRPATLEGTLPVGYYPTAVAATPDGKRLLVTNANGVDTRTPNGKPAGPDGKWGQYVLDIIEGTVSTIPVPSNRELEGHTKQVVANNQIRPGMEKGLGELKNPGIKHVIYIIKENRTYDQVFGDIEKGNGDPSLVMFGRDVTPNQHALAERFVLLDNFFVCADVSQQGWNWSTSGMLSEYTARNVPYTYTGRGRPNNNAGRNNEIIPYLAGVPDVAEAPCGYIWDLALRHGVELRNYGFFAAMIEDGERKAGRKVLSPENVATKKGLDGRTDESFRVFDLTYADSEAWVRYNCPASGQRLTYGAYNAPCRFTEWKREFDQYVKKGELPAFMLVRLPRNHTSGTKAGLSSPRAMVADNDYAVGQLVEAVSKSPFWKETAICILEDDAQNGHDHVDAHRSPALVISPFVAKGSVDHHFYNTDSMLRTMEALLGLPPMNQFDAIAAPIAVFDEQAGNDAVYQAILPAREIIAEVNTPKAYKAKKSAALDFSREDAVPDAVLNDILWHAVKGAKVPEPAVRHGLRLMAETDEDDD